MARVKKKPKLPPIPTCPVCGSGQVYVLKKQRAFSCRRCGTEFFWDPDTGEYLDLSERIEHDKK